MLSVRKFKRVFSVVKIATFSQQTGMGSFVVIFFESSDGGRRNPLLGPDKHFPYPGDVKISLKNFEYESKNSIEELKLVPADDANAAPWKAFYESGSVKYCATINLKSASKRTSVEPSKAYTPEVLGKLDRAFSGKIEICITECPQQIRQLMMPHFRNVNWNRNDLYAVTISQVLDAVDTDTSQNEKSKTISASDRERFLAFFLEIGDDFCARVKKRNNWADFINPSNGKPRVGTKPYNSLLEHDKELAGRGFQISKSGSCKIVEDVSWENQGLIGTIFTDASVSTCFRTLHNVLKRIDKDVTIKYQGQRGTKSDVKKGTVEN